MARLGKITTQPCVTDPLPPDPRCADDAFRLSHPEICPAVPRLVIQPSFALACKLGSVQFHASYIDENYIETDVTDQTTFQSSDWNIAVVGAASGNAGNATGLSSGTASITGTYQNLTSFAKLTILGDNCCDDQNVAMMVMVDRTRSMKEPTGNVFSSTYSTKLDFAKAAAQRFISEVNGNKDTVGLITFTAAGYDVLYQLTSNKNLVAAAVPGITHSQQLTTFYDALQAAKRLLNKSGVVFPANAPEPIGDEVYTSDLRVLLIISDGEDKDDSYSSTDNPVSLLQEFKDSGGIVITLGVRAHDFGYNLLSAFSTGGFFLNAHNAVASNTLDYLTALKSYICASNCAPNGDTIEATGTLNYCGFEKWNVIDGHVDLIGNGFLDLIPGNGLYVDLAGSRAEYKGKLESKDSYTIEQDKIYSVTLSLAGNNRIDAEPNSVQVKVYARNTNTIPDQDFTTAPVLSGGAGSAYLETYEYAFSYVNAAGETVLTPSASIANGSFETFTITLTPDAVAGSAEQPSLVRLWKREQGTTKWYLIAEGSPGSEFTDTLNNARLEAALLAGTIDPCNIPVEQNTTGGAIVLFEQDITVDDFRQGFTEYNLSFTASQDAEAWLSIQQLETPAGYDSTGLLLDSVTFENVTDDDVLLEDDFDTENMVYVPPGCGVGTTYVLLESGVYGYAVGYNNSECCSYYITQGDGALDLIPSMTSNTTPSGEAKGSTDGLSDYVPWWAFDYGNDLDNLTSEWHDCLGQGREVFIQYSFPSAKRISAYRLAAVVSHPTNVAPPKDWTLQGSNDEVDWATLDTQAEITSWSDGVEKTFSVSTSESYRHYKMVITASVPHAGTDCAGITMMQLVGGEDSITATDNCPPCPTEFPGIQSPDPAPLVDNEVTPPPAIHNATADVTRSCATGSIYVPDAALSVVTAAVSHCPESPITLLNGLRWEMRVYGACSQYHGSICPAGSTCVNPPIVDPHPCDPADQTVVLYGNVGTTYNVTLRFRGIVERQTFAGVLQAGTDGCFVQVPSYPGIAASSPGNAYYLVTTNPNRLYTLNSIAGQGVLCYLIDYQATIEINAASIVSLLARSRDGLSNYNLVLGYGPTAGTYGPATVPDIVNKSAAEPNEPFPGQFIQMDVVSVVAQP